MSDRFKYEAPNGFLKAALSLTTPRRWRALGRPWIFDKVTGVRIQPSEDEDAILRRLAGVADETYDRLVQAMMDKRRGYGFEWNRLASSLPQLNKR
jgi:hypothetical protein